MPKIPCKTFDPDNPTPAKYAHLKRDGYFMEVWRGMCMSTTGDNYAQRIAYKYPQLADLPTQVMFGAELYVEGVDRSLLKRYIAEQSPLVQLEVFASYLHSPDTMLEDIQSVCNEVGLNFVPWVHGPRTPQMALDMSLDIPQDLEGYVFKDGNHLNWRKVKRHQTIDLIIQDFIPAKPGKYFGMVGSIECRSTEGFTICACSGMDDGLRASLDRSMIGQVVEIGFTEVGTQGGLIHPRYLRPRPDKSPNECLVSQHPKLEKFYAHR